MGPYHKKLLAVWGFPADFGLPFIKRFLDAFGKYRAIHHIDDQAGRLVPIVAVSYDAPGEATRICDFISENRFLGIEARLEGIERSRRGKCSRGWPDIKCKLDVLRAEYEKHVTEQNMAEQLIGSYRSQN